MFSKKGSAYILIYGFLFFLFLGTMFIIFNQIQKNEISEIIHSSSLNISSEDISEAERFEGLWNFTPYIFIFLFIVFVFVHIGMSNGG